jgi:putative transposase
VSKQLLARQPFPTRLVARTALFECIEVFYTRQRRHSALGYLSPETLKRRLQETSVVA